ncbi:uncharacterized protein KZ484_026095 [Pholidichthys leucotaenia]
MKLFTCCQLLLQIANIVLSAPNRERRESVLSFLNDALSTATEKSTPASTTVYKNPPCRLVNVQDSEDTSEAASAENFHTIACARPVVSITDGDESRDTSKGLSSDEIMIPVVAKDKAPLKRTAAVGRNAGMTSSLIQDHGSVEQREIQGEHQANGGQIDPNSAEETMTKAQGSVAQSPNPVQRKTPSRRVNGPNIMVAQGQNEEMLDVDSLEANNGRLAPVDNSRQRDYDETREYTSSETYSLLQSSLSVPAESRAA